MKNKFAIKIRVRFKLGGNNGVTFRKIDVTFTHVDWSNLNQTTNRRACDFIQSFKTLRFFNLLYQQYFGFFKSWGIKTTYILRLHYRLLSKLLVEESKLSDEDLLYYMTHYEIGQIIDNFNPTIIMR